MKNKLIITGAFGILLPILGIIASFGSSSLVQADNETIRIEVSHNGFNQTPGEFQIEVEAGQEVAITFVYGDEDLLDNNPHRIFIPDFKIATDILSLGLRCPIVYIDGEDCPYGPNIKPIYHDPRIKLYFTRQYLKEYHERLKEK